MIPKSEYIKSVEQINQSAHNEALRQLDYDLLAQRAATEINMVVLIKNQNIMQRLHLRCYSHLGAMPKIKDVLNSLYRWGWISETKIEVSTENDMEVYFDSHFPEATEFIARALQMCECGFVMSELDRENKTYIRIHAKNHPAL